MPPAPRPPLRESETYPTFKFSEVTRCVIKRKKIFLNFFLKGQGSLALYQIPLVSESKGKGVDT